MGHSVSDNTKKKISENNGKYWLGKTFSDNHIKNLIDNHKGMAGNYIQKKQKEKYPMLIWDTKDIGMERDYLKPTRRRFLTQ